MEQTCPLIGVDVQPALGVEERGVRSPVVVEVRPGESPRPVHVREQFQDLERAVAVVPQDERRTGARRDDQVQVAVHVHVRRPGAEVIPGEGRGVEAGFRGNVAELVVRVLPEEPQAAGAGQHQTGPEVVVPIHRKNAISGRRSLLLAAGERKRGAGPAHRPHLRCVGDERDRVRFVRQPDREGRIPRRPRDGFRYVVRGGGGIERQAEVRRRRGRPHRLQTKELFNRLAQAQVFAIHCQGFHNVVVFRFQKIVQHLHRNGNIAGQRTIGLRLQQIQLRRGLPPLCLQTSWERSACRRPPSGKVRPCCPAGLPALPFPATAEGCMAEFSALRRTASVAPCRWLAASSCSSASVSV